jgi:hypothetical protein
MLSSPRELSVRKTTEGNWVVPGGRAWSVAGLALALTLNADAAKAAFAQKAQQQGQSQNETQNQAQGQDQSQSPAQQDQQPQAQGQSQPDQSQQQAPPDQSQPGQKKPRYYPQDANRPPYNNDRGPSPYTAPPPPEMYGQDEQGTPDEQQAPPPRQSRGHATRPSQPTEPVPATLTIPPGTVLSVRMNEFLSSDKNQIGDRVTATLDRPIVVNGWVVARRGQTLTGQVTAATKAGRIKGTSQLGIELTDLTLVDGQSMPILTEMWKASAGTSHGADAATIGGTTALGAAIGAAADWGRGAAIGAGAGAAAGIGAVLLTRGRATEVLPETPLTFRLVDPVNVDTRQGAQAFAPVTQQDFDGGHKNHGARHYAGGYPPPPPPCGYYGACYPYSVYPYPVYAYPYPYPYVTFYGGWGHRGWWR